MRNWLIYEPPGGGSPTLEGVEGFVTLREGFSKLAFVLPLVWLIWRRCWRALAVYAVVEIALGAFIAIAGLSDVSAITLALLPNLAVGFEAAWLRARSLERRGYQLAGSVLARSREEAEALFFEDYLKTAGAREPAPVRTVDAPYRPAQRGVLGLFPEPGAAR
jgi:hypothetical protein